MGSRARLARRGSRARKESEAGRETEEPRDLQGWTLPVQLDLTGFPSPAVAGEPALARTQTWLWDQLRTTNTTKVTNNKHHLISQIFPVATRCKQAASITFVLTRFQFD